jgi:long-chain acyl-CoA synthetase
MQFPNIYSLFRAQCEKHGERTVFYARRRDGWESTSWNELEDQVLDLACALLARGLTKGASVAILAGNIPEWTICDIATIVVGGVGVGLYPTSSSEQCEFIINHSDAEFVFVDTAAQLEKLAGLTLPRVKEIIIIDPADRSTTISTRRVTAFSELLRFGRSRRDELLPRIDIIGRGAIPDDIAIMVYTSGTTGQPKGAMLSHRYILNSVESLRQSVPIFDTDISLSYLPGCHVAERISGIYNRLYNGAAAYFVDDLSKLYDYMLWIKPTVFASLPRFFEKIHAKVVGESGGTTVDDQTVRDAFGGNVRLLTSGGAPLPMEIADFFDKHGLPILQAYGLTENICVAFNTVAEHKFGTVGKPMPMCEVRIAYDGEILVRSEMMFSRYYKEPEKTAEMFDKDGWLKTGDLGELDDDGFVKITGRKKEIIVLSTGKNVAPSLVENYVKESHLISQCYLHGDGHSYCVALITLNAAEASSLASVNGKLCNMADLVKNEIIRSAVEAAVRRANARVSGPEQIKRYVLLDHDLSAECDEITPTMKLKRNVIAENYRVILESLYENL